MSVLYIEAENYKMQRTLLLTCLIFNTQCSENNFVKQHTVKDIQVDNKIKTEDFVENDEHLNFKPIIAIIDQTDSSRTEKQQQKQHRQQEQKQYRQHKRDLHQKQKESQHHQQLHRQHQQQKKHQNNRKQQNAQQQQHEMYKAMKILLILLVVNVCALKWLEI